MGLKSTLQEKMQYEPQSRDEDLLLIQKLQEQNSTLRSEKQELLSMLTTANEQIELLTSRAASVNETEIRNKELLRKAEEAESRSDKALAKAELERQRAEYARMDAERADAEQRKEARQREAAEIRANKAKAHETATKSRYMGLFIGIVIFTITLAVLTAYSRRSVFAECGKWFADRGNNLISIFLWLKSSFVWISGWISGLLGGIAMGWCYVIASVMFLLAAAGLYFAFKALFAVLHDKIRVIRLEYTDGVFKGILTASVTITLFYVCLFLYEQIKSIVSLNIFSIWLLMSLTGAAAINGKEIVGGMRRG